MTYAPRDYDNWKHDIKRELLRYSIGGGQVLSELELNKCWMSRLSINQVVSISSDASNGWTFDEAWTFNVGLDHDA